MPIPDLNAFGVLPPGYHICSLQEIEERFCNSPQRDHLWTQFGAFLQWMNQQVHCPSVLFIDGSFTSDKSVPQDIDVVADLSGLPDAGVVHWFGIYANRQTQIKQQYSVHFFIYSPTIGPHDLRQFFQYVRTDEALRRGMDPSDRKGLLEVHL